MNRMIQVASCDHAFNKNKEEINSKPPEQNNASFQNVHTGI